MVEGSVKPYKEEDSEKLRPIVRLECRGLEPEEFSPRDGWRVVSNSDCATVFSDVDLADGVSGGCFDLPVYLDGMFLIEFNVIAGMDGLR